MVKIGLEGRLALVTGGASGIGAAIAGRLAEAGAAIAVVDRKEGGGAGGELEPVRERARRFLYVRADAASFDEAQRAVGEVLEEVGRLDILVNNAGVTRDAVVWKMSEADWDEVLDVDLKGFFNFARAVAPAMRGQKSGRIVNISSINGLRGKFGQTNYCAAKAGVVGLTKALARELGPSGITVNAVAPGFVLTEMTAALDEGIKRAALEETVLGCLGRPEDVADLVLFLTSDLAGHITGEVVRVDGGQYI